MDELKIAREEISNADAEIARLFVKRMKAVATVAEYKKKHGLPIYDKERELALLNRAGELVDDPEIREFYTVFQENTMAVSRSYQERLMQGMRVAYSGTEGAFAHIASNRLFPTAIKVSYPDFSEAYAAVCRGECDVAVLPIENSYNGEVGQVSDLMFSGTLFVNEITDVAITQDLLGVKGASIDSVKTIVSHPQALGQCRNYISEHGFEAKEYANTALAAKMVAELGDASVAAIASAEAAEIFGLEVLERNINESRMNTTRFAVFSRVENRHQKNDMGVHTVLLFTVRNEAGALAKAIDVIGRHGFNMRSIRSRPMKELLWQYYFYVEAEGNLYTDEGREMMAELMQYCDRLKAVGTYVKGE